MDPSTFARSSPPPLIKDIIEKTLKSYRSTTNRIQSKTRALARLDSNPPRSVRIKATLNVSKQLDGSAKAQALRDQFAKQLEANEKALGKIVIETTQAELDLLHRELAALPEQAVEQLSTFYGNVHKRLFPDGPSWTDALASDQGQSSMAVTDFLNARQQLQLCLVRLKYDLAVEETCAEHAKAVKEAKTVAAMDLEATTPTTESVQELVHQRIQREVAPLKKQIAQLQALNGRASRPGAPTGGRTAQRPKQQKTSAKAPPKRPNGNGKADAKGHARSNEPSAKRPTAKPANKKPAKRNVDKNRSK